ncbi:kinase-like domain-containing protein [Podospora fimiseda]|uniref:Kinase-like domain-containing protein n=1 Tax=Podospora fimiseda TaxID=252190 RepID=A0AAN7BGW2_9PEZI|nr:kinase-like domain-containing protein [Podospora fimiseda]
MPSISAAEIHQVLPDHQPVRHPHRERRDHNRRHSHSHRKSSSDRKPLLPRIIPDDDPILEFPSEKWIASMIGNTGLLYRFSNDLVYKSNVTSKEVDLMEAAGDLTMRPLSRIIWNVSSSSPFRAGTTKAVIMEAGKQFRGNRIPEQKRRQVVVEMFRILENLHGKGIVHGNVKESNFLWSKKDGRLKIVDFSSARFIEDSKEKWNSTNVTNAYLTPERMMAAAQKEDKVLPLALAPPSVFDDYYALAITLWGIYTGKPAGTKQFNQINIKRTDLAEVRDEMIRGWIKKVFKMAGCKFVSPPSDPQLRREFKEEEQQQQERGQRHSVRD